MLGAQVTLLVAGAWGEEKEGPRMELWGALAAE